MYYLYVNIINRQTKSQIFSNYIFSKLPDTYIVNSTAMRSNIIIFLVKILELNQRKFRVQNDLSILNDNVMKYGSTIDLQANQLSICRNAHINARLRLLFYLKDKDYFRSILPGRLPSNSNNSCRNLTERIA
jgi:hypothetical protein